jgi:hypothetical protein
MQLLGELVTRLTKLGGLAVVLHEVFGEPTPRTPAIAIAAVMMTGAVSLDNFLRGFLKLEEAEHDKEEKE